MIWDEMILSGRNMLIEPSYYLRYTHISSVIYCINYTNYLREPSVGSIYIKCYDSLAAILYAALSIQSQVDGSIV